MKKLALLDKQQLPMKKTICLFLMLISTSSIVFGADTCSKSTTSSQAEEIFEYWEMKLNESRTIVHRYQDAHSDRSHISSNEYTTVYLEGLAIAAQAVGASENDISYQQWKCVCIFDPQHAGGYSSSRKCPNLQTRKTHK